MRKQRKPRSLPARLRRLIRKLLRPSSEAPLGPRPERREDCAAFVRLIAQGRLERKIAVTSRGKRDGIGAQATAIISAMVLARLAGCRYLHSPLSTVAHSIGSREDWAQRWEHFLNLGDGEALVPEGAELVWLTPFVRDPEAYAGRTVIVADRLFYLPRRGVSHALHALQPVLRAKYRAHGKGDIPIHRGPPGSMNVAVHLRRGDVSETANARRYVADEQVLRSIAQLRTAAAPFGRPLHINLYSEGTVEQFRAFADAGCNLHISADPFETFHNMVVADILLMGQSSFSELAGMLSNGIVVLPNQPWNHPAQLWPSRLPEPWPNWLNRRSDGELSIRLMRKALRARAH